MNINLELRATPILSGRYALAATVLLLAALLTPPAQAHAKLLAAEPKAEAVLAAAPAAIRLKFNDEVELQLSKVKLLDAKDVNIDALALVKDKADPKTLVATMPPLQVGGYRVQWAIVTRDGHKVKGEYAFTIK